MKGYRHPDYALSLREFGAPLELAECGGWVLKRNVPGSPFYDAMGCYPRFVCRDWSCIGLDLARLEGELISLSIVTDPFGEYEVSALRKAFDLVAAFKTHFVVDLRLPMEAIASRHKRRFAKSALNKVDVEVCSEPTHFLDEWVALYANIIERHRIEGIRAFSRTAFARQLSIPGTVLFRARHNGETVGFHWYFDEGELVYGHLAALAPAGYQCHAPYALQWSAIEYFRGKSLWLDLGAGAGVAHNGDEGLKLFKRGWSTDTRPVYFCGRILDRERYAEMVERRSTGRSRYFPAYRAGEFT